MNPRTNLDPNFATLVDQHKQKVFRELLRSNFAGFIGKCFQTLNPGTSYLHNWHIEAIAFHLEQVRLGKIKRLIITMPPRSAKSIAASIAFPAFIHGHDPTAEIVAVSYAQNLASKLHNDNRLVLSSDWYMALFSGARIDPKKETEQEVRLTQRGNRFATSVGGVLTGRGADIIIIDDPLKPDDAMSEAQRSRVNDWYSNTLPSRLNQKNEGAIVIVTQRLHIDDLVGHVTRYDENWTILDLPAIANEDQRIQVGTGKWYHRKRGELLHPDRENQGVFDELKAMLGASSFEAQYQQRPVPPGGNLFKSKWINYYDTLPEISDGVILQSWDTASKVGLANDWSVGTTWLYQDHFYYLIAVSREKLNYPDLKARMIAEAVEFDPWIVLIEDAGVGTGLIEDLRREGLNTTGITPDKSKEARATIETAKFQSSRVLFPRSAPWLDQLLTELLAFPGGRHDDQVDSIVQALAYRDVPENGGVEYLFPHRC